MSALGPGPELTPATVRRLAKKLERLERVRRFRSLLTDGASQTAAAAQVGISRSTATTWSTEWTTPSAEEWIERAAADGTPRTELVERLIGVEWLLHGFWDAETEFAASWMQLRNAVEDGLLTLDEYSAVCDSMKELVGNALGRSSCVARTCVEHNEHLYVLCYGEPTVVKSRDVCEWDRQAFLRDFDRRHTTYPITHYVGWTGQSPPIKRVYDHGRGSTAALVTTFPGSTYEESVIKAFGRCPRCDASLDYFADNTLRDHWNPMTFLAEELDHAAAIAADAAAQQKHRVRNAELLEWIKTNRPGS